MTWLSSLLLGAAFFMLSSCEDTVQNIGGELIPSDDRLSFTYTDSLDISLTTQLVDSVNTAQNLLHKVGNYIDPVFGRINAGTAIEFLPNVNLNFGTGSTLIFDSMVLELSFTSAYGRPDQAQNLHVYALTKNIPDTNQIYSSRIPAFEPIDLGPPTSLVDADGSGNFVLRIKLDDVFGKSILEADSQVLADDDLFRIDFPGFYLTTDPVQFFIREPGAIFYLEPRGGLTRLVLSYKIREAGSQAFVAETEIFSVSTSSRQYHTLVRTEVSDKLITQALSTPDTQAVYEFAQEGMVIRNLLKLPGIDSLGSVSVHNAEVELFVLPEFLGNDDIYNPPAELLLFYADENGNIDLDEEGNQRQFLTVSAPYSNLNQSYTLDLTRYVQEVVNGQAANNGLIVIPRDIIFQVNRVVFGGLDHPSLPPKLNLSYSSLPRR